MTITEILEQAKQLSLAERKELTKRLIDIMDSPQETSSSQADKHWGQSLNQLFAEMDAIEMKYPEIEDPVEWLHALRAERRKQLTDNLEGDE
jgi:hypothetical protein